MQTWSITLHGPAGIISTTDTAESQFVVGTETASDVFTVVGEGVSTRHAWLWINEAGLQVEDLGGGTLVNGYTITERVQAGYPASVQVGEISLLIELKAAQTPPASPSQSSLDITIPQRAVSKNTASLEVTIPQRMQKKPASGSFKHPINKVSDSQKHDAPLTGGYTLVREIARGGMGQIYFGEDPQLKRNVAVKVSSVSDRGEDPRFSKEAEVLAQLAHPNVVPIHNIGVDALGRPFYSMKLVKGRTLQAVLNLIRDRDAAAIKDYPRAALVTIFRKVCDAMMFAHSKGILHRDLKPENIMVGEYGEVLVMDWGLAKVLGEREENVSLVSRINDTGDYGMTMEGEVMGTPQYMSPEQADGMVAELDQRSDIYSLGGVLYAILTLRPPIEGITLDEVLTKVRTGNISSMITKRGARGGVTGGSPEAMGVEVPEALQAVTFKAMATDRNKRYGTVEQLAGDIERYQNGFATQAEGAGAIRQLTLFIKRNKGVSAAVALFMMAAAAFTLKLAASERVARENEKLALEEKEKSRRAAANAQFALADAAEFASDSVALRQVLSEVPEDLRTQDWDYFQGRIDTCTFSIPAPSDKGWKGLEDLPSDPERMVALRTDGKWFAVNVSTGTLESLWNFDKPSANEIGAIGVSADGKLIAIGYFRKDSTARTQVEVCKLQDGSRVAQLSGPERLRRIVMGDSLCILQGEGVQGDYKTEIWNHASAQLLWDLPICVQAEFSRDQKAVFVLTGRQGESAEKRDALSGKVLLEGVKNSQSIHTNWPSNGVGSTDWKKFFSPEYGSTKIRAVIPWTGKVEFEVSPRYGNYACTLIPPGEFMAVLGRTSAEAAVVEIRSASTGMLSRSLPVLVPLPNESSSAALRAKQGVIALRSARALKIWRVESLKPSLSMGFGYAGVRRGNTSQIVTQLVSGEIKRMQLCDCAEIAPGKRALQELGGWNLRSGNLILVASPDGSRWLAGGSGVYGAYRLGDSGFEELWSPRKILVVNIALGFQNSVPYAIHPVEDRLWTGSAVYEFSTGQNLLEVKDREGFNTAYSAVWVGTTRVAEIAFKDQQRDSEAEQTTGEKVQIILWDTESGRLVAKAKASNANCLSVSPDGLHLAEAGADKRVRIRSSRTLEVEREFRAHEDSVSGVAWHPKLPLLVTASKDGCIRVWNRDDFRRVEEFASDPSSKPVLLEIPPNGMELNEVRQGAIRVYQPKSFRESVQMAP